MPVHPRPLRDLVISFVDYGNQDAEQDCLASAVYFEARGETLEGQLAVAEVVMNRAASGHYPPTICSVVTQPAQFSFVRRGKFPPIDRTSDCWHKAQAIADIARKRLAQQVAPNVLWYHANYVAPNWGRRLTRVAQIGSHIFYS
jgi:spore germination cell wall hydrolase CwlJ-like protein